MRLQATLVFLTVLVGTLGITSSAHAQQAEPHGWLGTETVKTRFGDFEFKNGYPAGERPSACSNCRSSTGRSRST